MKRLTIFGFIVTGIWFAAFAWVLAGRWGEALCMGLNEWGDFLAGLTAPLALFWIVIGFFLQGKELHVNTEALKSQQEELRRQVEETALLAKSSVRQATAAEKVVELSQSDQQMRNRSDWIRRKIRLKVTQGINAAQGRSNVVLKNMGETVTQVTIGAALTDFTLKGSANLHPGDETKLAWPSSKPYPMDLVLDYIDSVGNKRRSEFQLNEKGELHEQAETDRDGTPYFE